MTTDYDLPSWFWDEDTTDADRSRWMTQDRCRRQARRQTMPSLEAMQRRVDRLEHRIEARADTVDVEEYR
ncbi:hypothetical protein ORFS41 [Halorubrum tailed virus]|nr:hypothetical protein ORFS41 [Halorubrum tailed virus]